MCLAFDFQRKTVWSGKVWCSKARMQKTDKNLCTLDCLIWMILDTVIITKFWILIHLWLFMSFKKKIPHSHNPPPKENTNNISSRSIIDSSSWKSAACLNTAGNGISLGLCGCQVGFRTWSGTTEVRGGGDEKKHRDPFKRRVIQTMNVKKTTQKTMYKMATKKCAPFVLGKFMSFLDNP